MGRKVPAHLSWDSNKRGNQWQTRKDARMTTTKIKLPNWVQINLKDEEQTRERMSFILGLVKFIEDDNIDVCGIYPRVQRLYFDRRGAYLYQYNYKYPWRYNDRGLAQAKFELRRLKIEAETDKEYFTADSTEVRNAIEAFATLGWGHGMSSGERQLDHSDSTFRFFRRGRWYLLEPKKIADMLRRARKAQIIMGYFRSQYSLDTVPETLRPFCFDVLKHIEVVEETGEIRLEIRWMYRKFGSMNVDDVVKGWHNKRYPPTPNGVKQAKSDLRQAAKAWLSMAQFGN
jgi:hypothetical protein